MKNEIDLAAHKRADVGHARRPMKGSPRARWCFWKNTPTLFDINATTLCTILTDSTYARKPSH